MGKLKHVVCLGGGNAMPRAVLEGLKKYPVRISVISAMLDSGGSAGRERELFKTKVSFGDLRKAALVLSEVALPQKELFAYRYEGGFLGKEALGKGHVLANIYCTTIVGIENNIQRGVKELLKDFREDLKIPTLHQFFPATLDNATLCASLENGEIVRGEGNIDVPKHDGNLMIKKVFLEPEAKAYPPALKAIQEADLIVIGPGDLYSSLSQILLAKGISEAIRKSKAKKVYICNLMTKHGETNNFSVLDFTFEMERYLGVEVDHVIFNQNKPSPQRIASYKKEHPELLELVKFSEILDKEKFIGEDLITDQGPILHDPDKLAKLILDLCPTCPKQ